MGGHGGLNILPQKSWHVYNQDNREKVERDERQHEEEERIRKAKHDAAESEHRRQILLQRARGGKQPPAVLQDFQHLEVEVEGEAALVTRESTAIAPRKAAPVGHINFWQQDELRMGNHEKKAEQKDERRRRGDAATQTSDARFDERFQMAHGLVGDAARPWYAKPSLLSEAERRDMDNTQLQPGAVVPLLAAGGQRQDAAAEAADKRPAKEGKQKHKHKNKDKEKKSSRKQLQKKTASMATSDLDRLRAERRQREATERSRQLQMLRQTHRT